jgi:shikimate kinase
MGCGKSTVGEQLSKFLGHIFVDLDEYITERAQKSIPEIFAQDGEPYFRQLESECLSELALKSNLIVATGGGALLSPKNAEIAKSGGAVVFIDMPFEVCYERIKDDTNRPIVVKSTKQELLALYEKRKEFYLQASNVCVSEDLPPLALAKTIAEQLP